MIRSWNVPNLEYDDDDDDDDDDDNDDSKNKDHSYNIVILHDY